MLHISVFHLFLPSLHALFSTKDVRIFNHEHKLTKNLLCNSVSIYYFLVNVQFNSVKFCVFLQSGLKWNILSRIS